MTFEMDHKQRAIELANRLAGMTYAEWFRVKKLIDARFEHEIKDAKLGVLFSGIPQEQQEDRGSSKECERESLIRQYEHRLAQLKAGAPPSDIA